MHGQTGWTPAYTETKKQDHIRKTTAESKKKPKQVHRLFWLL
jgi:hypothetical protein